MIRNTTNAVWDRWANLHPFFRFLILSVVVAALGFFVGKPGYRALKAWRLERKLEAARKAVDVGSMDDARDLSLTVLRAGDPRIEAYRILEKSTASLRDPIHGEIARALMFHPEGSDEDRLNGFRGMIPDAPLGIVGQAWAALPAANQKDPRFATVFADRLLSEHRIREAATVLLAIPSEAQTPEVQRFLVRVLVGSGKQDGYDEAQRLIASGLPSDGADINEWLGLLEKIPGDCLREDLLGPVRKLLASPASANDAFKSLLLVRLDYATAKPDQREALLKGAVDRWKTSDPAALAHFLGGLGLYHLLLETFPPDRLGDKPEMLPQVLEAMERSGAWDQVAPMLDAQAGRLPKYEELAHRALAFAKTGDSAGLAREWDGAMQQAKSNSQSQSNAFITLYHIAEGAGEEDVACQALVEAIRLGRGPLPLYTELKPLLNALNRQARETTLLEICAIYFSFEPGNPVLLTQYAYLACVGNLADPKLVLKAMEALAKGFPKEAPIQCVLATVYLCDNQPAQAAEIFDHLNLQLDRIPPSYHAAYLTTQVLNKRLAKDDPSITNFPWKSLLPSERKKYTDLIRAAAP